VDRADLALLASPHGDAAEEPARAPHERPWYRLHDEVGAQAIDDAVASVEAAKKAGYFDDPDPPRTGEGDRDATRRGGGGSEHVATLMIEAASILPDPLAAIAEPLSPGTGKPLRPYKKRTPKPPFVGPG